MVFRDNYFDEFNAIVQKLMSVADEALELLKTHDDMLKIVSNMDMKEAYVLGNMIGSRVIDVGPKIVMDWATEMSSSKDSYVLGFCVGHLLMLIRQNREESKDEDSNPMFN